VAPVPFSTAATTTVVRYVQQANCIGIYWSGMDVNNNWLRVDIARKFDGIPQSQYRDIMEMTRPLKQFDEKKTFNVLNTLC
jgi:disulfide oxidoreductase YuzD